jgi:hypothetical protein
MRGRKGKGRKLRKVKGEGREQTIGAPGAVGERGE